MLNNLAAQPAAERDIQFVSGLGVLGPRYDVVLCDVWGVLHNGVTGFAPAREALARFRRGGGTVILVSNAPRPGGVIATQLAGFGVTDESYDAIVTSGDLTRMAVEARLDQRLYHLGPDRDLPSFEGLPARFGSVDEADYVVCTGLFDDETETAADYAPLLERMRARTLWMLCANPDIVVERGSRLIYCAGALAVAYEELGGEAFYPGKPHPPIYEHAIEVARRLRGSGIDTRRVLAIGDAIRTDIAGARLFGMDALMIARGIHAGELGLGGGGESRELDPVQVTRWLDQQEARPTAIEVELTWD